MIGFLSTFGVFTIILVMMYVIKKIDDFIYFKSVEELDRKTDNKKMLLAAKAFSQGSSDDEVKDLLLNSIEFDEDDADEILYLSKNHRSDRDGGLSFFLNTANVLKKG